jgi:hypothetical protein
MKTALIDGNLFAVTAPKPRLVNIHMQKELLHIELVSVKIKMVILGSSVQ